MAAIKFNHLKQSHGAEVGKDDKLFPSVAMMRQGDKYQGHQHFPSLS